MGKKGLVFILQRKILRRTRNKTRLKHHPDAIGLRDCSLQIVSGVDYCFSFIVCKLRQQPNHLKFIGKIEESGWLIQKDYLCVLR